MPVYEYECLKCGDRFEEIQKFADAPLTTHDHCGGTVKKLLSAPAFQFKGTGWYITDYARKSSGDGKDGKKEPAEAKTDKTGDKSGAAKSEESKPAAKSTKS